MLHDTVYAIQDILLFMYIFSGIPDICYMIQYISYKIRYICKYFQDTGYMLHDTVHIIQDKVYI